jgi:small-conductance mechanosensitive channel
MFGDFITGDRVQLGGINKGDVMDIGVLRTTIEAHENATPTTG